MLLLSLCELCRLFYYSSFAGAEDEYFWQFIIQIESNSLLCKNIWSRQRESGESNDLYKIISLFLRKKCWIRFIQWKWLSESDGKKESHHNRKKNLNTLFRQKWNKRRQWRDEKWKKEVFWMMKKDENRQKSLINFTKNNSEKKRRVCIYARAIQLNWELRSLTSNCLWFQYLSVQIYIICVNSDWSQRHASEHARTHILCTHSSVESS